MLSVIVDPLAETAPAASFGGSLWEGSFMFKASVGAAPAPWFVTLLGSVVALVVSLGHLTTVQAAVLTSLAMAAGTLVVAARTRPVAVATIAGACGIVIGDLSIFGLHVTADTRGALVGLVTFGLGAFLHLIHVPVSDTTQDPGVIVAPASAQPPAGP